MSACARVVAYARAGVSAAPVPARTVIYISDFRLGASAFGRESGLLPLAPVAPGPLGSVVPRAFGIPEDPSTRVRELLDMMSVNVRDDLASAGFEARRLAAEQPVPDHGWLVRGTFTDLREGNRLGRALIGLGAGKTHFQVFVFVDELAPGAIPSTWSLSSSAASSVRPGAIFTLNPIVAAADFVSCGLDLDRSMIETASTIAGQITQHIRNQHPAAAHHS